MRHLSLAVLCLFSLCTFASENNVESTLGSGNDYIHVIPALSKPSVKNGQRVRVTAVVKAAAGVRSVEADMGGIETLTLAPDLHLGGMDASGSTGIWSGEWTGRCLEEKIYTVTLKISDRAGHVFEDRSLEFSDPAAGLSTPGSAYNSHGGLRRLRGDSVLPVLEGNFESAVYDSARGIALFGSDTKPGIVVKVALGAAGAPPTRVGSLVLQPGEDNLEGAVFDRTTGVALFLAEGASPGIVIKVAFGAPTDPPSRVGSLTLNTGEDAVFNGIVDTQNGVALLGTYTAPGIVVKVALGAATAAPTRLGAVTLNAGENYPYSAIFDPSTSEALFACYSSPSVVVKIATNGPTGNPTRVGAVTLNAGENSAQVIVLDPANHVALVGCRTSPSVIVKVAVNAAGVVPARVGALTLNTGENNVYSGAIDPANGVAYFGIDTQPAQVVKVALGAVNAAPTRVGALIFNTGEDYNEAMVLDTASNTLLVGDYDAPGTVVKVAAGAPNAAPTRVGVLTLPLPETRITAPVYDAANNLVLVSSGLVSPANVVKLALNEAGQAPTRVGAVTLSGTEGAFTCGVLDVAHNVALFGQGGSPSRVVKIALNAPSAAPTEVGAVALNVGENSVASAVFDPATSTALFGTNTSIGTVVKIASGLPGDPPTRVGAVTLNAGEGYLAAAVADVANGQALFGCQVQPGIAVKVLFNAAGAPPTRASALTFQPGENGPANGGGAFDPVTGTALFVSTNTPSVVVKVAMNAPAAAPTEVGSVTLNANEQFSKSIVIDSANGAALIALGGNVNTYSIVKINLGAAAALPTRDSALALSAPDVAPGVMVFDGSRAAATMFTTSDVITGITKFGSGNFFAATKAVLSEAGQVTDLRFYTHAASGNLVLGIYDNSPAKKLLWQSGTQLSTVANGEVVAPISAGTPSTLIIPAGTYWLAWQSSTPSNAVASLTAGVAGDGFVTYQNYGPLPTTVAATAQISTSDKFTEYFTYAQYQAPAFTSGPTATPNPTGLNAPAIFNAAATSAPNTTLTYAWSFGDGAVATGASVTHGYAAVGVYTATVTATDSNGVPTSASVQVTVNQLPAVVGFGPDSDGDGFSDSLETAYQSNPNDYTSTPFNNSALSAIGMLTVTKPTIKLNFAKKLSDMIKFSGTLSVPAGFVVKGQKVLVVVGEVLQGFTLDATGSNKVGGNSFKVTIKLTKKAVLAQTAKYSVTLSKGTFATGLAGAGLTNAAATNATVTVPYTVVFNGIALQKQQTMSYTATKDKSGSAK